MLDTLLAHNPLPDAIVRAGIRSLLRGRMREWESLPVEENRCRQAQWIEHLRSSPIALQTEAANSQHYEVPAAFFEKVLGARLKYSCALWSHPQDDLDRAEEHMLEKTCARAQVADGHSILELGCGWGSLTLWLAEHYPHSEIVPVSNSHSQRQWIEQKCLQRGWQHVEVITSDINHFSIDRQFDRVLSVEMFEHLRNYEIMLERISKWLKSDGRLFLHFFCHRSQSYPFEIRGAGDWMARHFFTGGMMPAADTLHHFQNHLAIEEQWMVNGHHYARTCRAWLDKMDRQRDAILPLFAQCYGRAKSRRWWHYWRLFFMACEELFAAREGREWFVGHFRLRPR